MSNIAVRSNGGIVGAPSPLSENMGSRLWRDILRWDPFAEMLPLPSFVSQLETFTPNFDVKETKESFVFSADLPGLEPKDVDVQITDNRLTISGKREREKEETSDTTYRCERSFGAFSRSFTLPTGCDSSKVRAELSKGVLQVSVPRLPQAKPKQIPVTGT